MRVQNQPFPPRFPITSLFAFPFQARCPYHFGGRGILALRPQSGSAVILLYHRPQDLSMVKPHKYSPTFIPKVRHFATSILLLFLV